MFGSLNVLTSNPLPQRDQSGWLLINQGQPSGFVDIKVMKPDATCMSWDGFFAICPICDCGYIATIFFN